MKSPVVPCHAWRACLLAAATVTSASADAQVAKSYVARSWVGIWGTAPAGPPLAPALQTFHNQTLRLIVHASIGGASLRIRISNERGAVPLRIGEAHIALRRAGADIVPASDRALTFSGFPSITIPAGAVALSDGPNLTCRPCRTWR